MLLDTSDAASTTIATSIPQYNIENAFSGPSISASGRLVAYGDEGLNVHVYDATAGSSSLVSRNTASNMERTFAGQLWTSLGRAGS